MARVAARETPEVSTPRDVTTVVWLPAALLHEMAVAAQRLEPKEAGGILAGYWSTKFTECVVTHVIDAGPNAEHRATGMTPDAAYQEAELDRIFEETRGASVYIAEWHTHPTSAPAPSATDRATLRRIALDPEAHAPEPLMLILGNEDNAWGAVGWQGRFGLFGRFGPLHTDPVELRVG